MYNIMLFIIQNQPRHNAVHVNTCVMYNYSQTSFCLADDSTNEAFHSPANFFPISAEITLKKIHTSKSLYHCYHSTHTHVYVCRHQVCPYTFACVGQSCYPPAPEVLWRNEIKLLPIVMVSTGLVDEPVCCKLNFDWKKMLYQACTVLHSL